MSVVVTIAGEPIANFTIIIKRGGSYVEEFIFCDENGDPLTLLDAKIVYEPNGATADEWTQANGHFTFVATGTYLLNFDEAYTAAITWDSGSWHAYIVEDSGFTDPCVTSGLLFAEDC